MLDADMHIAAVNTRASRLRRHKDWRIDVAHTASWVQRCSALGAFDDTRALYNNERKGDGR